MHAHAASDENVSMKYAEIVATRYDEEMEPTALNAMVMMMNDCL